DEQRCSVRREHGVRVERYDVADLAKRLQVADDRGEACLRIAAQHPVELRELASLALPAHPHTLTRVPPARSMKQVEQIGRAAGVSRVERTYSGLSRIHDRRIAVHGFGWCIHEVAEHG